MKTLDELDRLPPDVSDDPVTELLSLIRNFISRIESVIDGSVASGLCVVQSATGAYEQFTEDIGSKTPRFRPFSKQSAVSNEFQEFPAALELDQLDTKNMTADILYLDDILQKAKRYALWSCILRTELTRLIYHCGTEQSLENSQGIIPIISRPNLSRGTSNLGKDRRRPLYNRSRIVCGRNSRR